MDNLSSSSDSSEYSEDEEEEEAERSAEVRGEENCGEDAEEDNVCQHCP
jgi:hypothetical protein